AFFLAGLFDGRVDPSGSIVAAELARQIVASIDPFGRNAGVELIRPPARVEFDVGTQRLRLLEAPLADIAPRTHHVRDDVDGQLPLGLVHREVSCLGSLCLANGRHASTVARLVAAPPEEAAGRWRTPAVRSPLSCDMMLQVTLVSDWRI